MKPSHLQRAARAAVCGCCIVTLGTVLAQKPLAVSALAARPDPAYAIQMPPVTPNKSEIASSAFEKLDTLHVGYVTRDDAAKLEGFDRAFAQADKNQDGRLSPAEFNVAWAIYTRSGG